MFIEGLCSKLSFIGWSNKDLQNNRKTCHASPYHGSPNTFLRQSACIHSFLRNDSISLGNVPLLETRIFFIFINITCYLHWTILTQKNITSFQIPIWGKKKRRNYAVQILHCINSLREILKYIIQAAISHYFINAKIMSQILNKIHVIL